MSVISTLDILLRAKNGPLDKDLNDAANKVDRFSNRIDAQGKKTGGFASSLLSGLTGISGKLGLALAGIGATAAIGSWGVKLAAEAETANMGFEIMLGSAEKAKILMAQIQKFGAETPFETKELVKATRGLLSFGVDAGDVMTRLKELGDVASGSQSKIEDLAQIFGKAFVKNKVELEQLNQAAERGIPLYKVLAEQLTGGNTKKMAKMVSDGKVTADQLTKAFQTMSGDGGIFSNAMKKQSGTLAGLWSTLGDGVSMIGKEIGETLIDAFNIKGLAESIIAGNEKILNGFKLWRPVVVEGVQTAIQAFTGLKDTLVNFAGQVGSIFAPMTNWIGTVLPQGWTSLRDKVLSVIFYLQGAMNNMGNSFKGSLLNVQADFESMWQTVKYIDQNIGRAFINMGIVIASSLTQIGTNVKNAFMEIWDFIASKGKDKIEFTWAPMGEAGKKAMEDLAKSFDRPMTDLEKDLRKRAKEAGEKVIEDIGKHINDKMQAVKDKEKEVTGELSGKIDQPPDDSDDKKDKKKKEAEGVNFGSKKAFEVIAGVQNSANDPARIAKQQLKAQQEANVKLDAIRVAVAGGAALAPI